MSWEEISTVRHYRGDAYLYLSPEKAFIFPDVQANVTDAEILKHLTWPR